MVLPRNVRLENLKKLSANGDARVAQSKLYYKGDSKQYDVFKIDLDHLIYNRHNGRLESDMLTWQYEHATGDDQYTEELDLLIEEFLWRDNVSRNKHTIDDLERKGQQRSGIVTLDGVIIDGNRRAMLLKKLGEKRKEKRYFEAIILPDAYDANEKEIVRLETQYQMGEDAKLDYGPLEKYLHVKRLRNLDIEVSEIAQLMGDTDGGIEKLLDIMALMDDYLAHICCDGLYNMLKEEDGSTKEGMFVDLYQDIKRFEGGSAQVQWAYDEVFDVLELKTTQFDHTRYGGDLSDTNKRYRAISHDGSGKKSFFAHEEIWKKFTENHRENVEPVTTEMGTLDNYCADHPEIASVMDAARRRDREWKERISPDIKRNFGTSVEALSAQVEIIEPTRLLERALNSLERIDIDSDGFLADRSNLDLVREINRLSFDMKKRFERA